MVRNSSSSSSADSASTGKWAIGLAGASVVSFGMYMIWKQFFSKEKEFDESADRWDSIPLVQIIHKNVSSSLKSSLFWKERIQRGHPISLLDFGGGTGLNTLSLADDPIVQNAVCADVSSSMIKVCEKKLFQEQYKAVAKKCKTLLLESDDASEIVENQFDLVLSAFVLHHVSEEEGLRLRVLRTLVQSLRDSSSALAICEFEEKVDDEQDEHHTHNHSHPMTLKIESLRESLTQLDMKVSELIRFEVNDGKWKCYVMICSHK